MTHLKEACKYGKHEKISGGSTGDVANMRAWCEKTMKEVMSVYKTTGVETYMVMHDIENGKNAGSFASGTEMRHLVQMSDMNKFPTIAKDMYNYGMEYSEPKDWGEHDWHDYMGEKMDGTKTRIKQARYSQFLRASLGDAVWLFGSHTQGHRINLRGNIQVVVKELLMYHKKKYQLSPFLMRCLGSMNIVETLEPDEIESPFTPLCWNPGKVVVDEENNPRRAHAPKKVREFVYREKDKRKSLEATIRGRAKQFKLRDNIAEVEAKKKKKEKKEDRRKKRQAKQAAKEAAEGE
jgi:hypothetical protein